MICECASCRAIAQARARVCCLTAAACRPRVYMQGNLESKRLCRASWAAIRLLRCLNMSYAYYDTAVDQTLSCSLLAGARVRTHQAFARACMLRVSGRCWCATGSPVDRHLAPTTRRARPALMVPSLGNTCVLLRIYQATLRPPPRLATSVSVSPRRVALQRLLARTGPYIKDHAGRLRQKRLRG